MTRARDLVAQLREAGFTVELGGSGGLQVAPAEELSADGRRWIRDNRLALRRGLQQERTTEALALVAVDPDTGRLPLSLEDSPREAKIQRLRQLARHPAFGDRAPAVAEVVEEAREDGLSDAGALELIHKLGRRIRERRPAGRGRGPAAGACRECGRPIGPSVAVCGRCRREVVGAVSP